MSSDTKQQGSLLVRWLNTDSRSRDQVVRGCMSRQQKLAVVMFAALWLLFLALSVLGTSAMFMFLIHVSQLPH